MSNVECNVKIYISLGFFSICSAGVSKLWSIAFTWPASVIKISKHVVVDNDKESTQFWPLRSNRVTNVMVLI